MQFDSFATRMLKLIAQSSKALPGGNPKRPGTRCPSLTPCLKTRKEFQLVPNSQSLGAEGGGGHKCLDCWSLPLGVLSADFSHESA